MLGAASSAHVPSARDRSLCRSFQRSRGSAPVPFEISSQAGPCMRGWRSLLIHWPRVRLPSPCRQENLLFLLPQLSTHTAQTEPCFSFALATFKPPLRRPPTPPPPKPPPPPPPPNPLMQ
jgi:hypothetical protein